MVVFESVFLDFPLRRAVLDAVKNILPYAKTFDRRYGISFIDVLNPDIAKDLGD